MLRWLVSTIHGRCAFCGERVTGAGVRRGLRVFCSPAAASPLKVWIFRTTVSRTSCVTSSASRASSSTRRATR